MHLEMREGFCLVLTRFHFHNPYFALDGECTTSRVILILIPASRVSHSTYYVFFILDSSSTNDLMVFIWNLQNGSRTLTSRNLATRYFLLLCIVAIQCYS
jgi:hypothetical protein